MFTARCSWRSGFIRTLFGTLSLVVKERGEVFTRQGLNRVRVKAAFGERVRGVMRFSLALVTM